MTGRLYPGHLEDAIRLTWKVLEALPPLSREDEALAVIVMGDDLGGRALAAGRRREHAAAEPNVGLA